MDEEIQDIESQVLYDPENVVDPIEFEKTEAPNEQR